MTPDDERLAAIRARAATVDAPWVGDDVRFLLAMVDKLKEDARACPACERTRRAEVQRDHLKECWEMTCGQIAQMCVRLGADEGDMVDAWMLRDLIERVIRERDTLRARVARLERALRATEWGSCDGCAGGHFCPVCHRPNMRFDDDINDHLPADHAPECIVRQALAALDEARAYAETRRGKVRWELLDPDDPPLDDGAMLAKIRADIAEASKSPETWEVCLQRSALTCVHRALARVAKLEAVASAAREAHVLDITASAGDREVDLAYGRLWSALAALDEGDHPKTSG
jgi:hypothetical protein